MSKELMQDIYETILSGSGDDPTIDWEAIRKKLRRVDDEPLVYLYYRLHEIEIKPDVRLLTIYVAGELMVRGFSLRQQEVYKDNIKLEKPNI